MPNGEQVVTSATCLGCGCACDDIGLRIRSGRIIDAQNACVLGVEWFGDGSVPVVVSVDGQPASLDDALAAAARLLTGARRPLIYLAPDISCDAQREGVALADALRATCDSVTSASAREWILAAQERGRASATLGEIRNRADVLVFWGVDPARRYPRYFSRYAPEPSGLHVTEGRRGRHVIAVDVGESRGPADADQRVAIAVDREVAALTALTAMVQRGDADPASDNVRELFPRLIAGKYVAVVADAEAAGLDRGRAQAIVALTQALNGPTRSALSVLRAGGNRSGADAVMTSSTGFPMAVDFARGYPCYRPHDGNAGGRLARGEVDLVVVLGSPSLVPAELLALMAPLPCVAIGPRASQGALATSAIVVDTGVVGIHEGSLALRMDDVPLPLRPPLDGPPQAAVVVRAIRERLPRF